MPYRHRRREPNWASVLDDPAMRAEADRGTVIVPTIGREVVSAAYSETRRIATGGLTGCTAVAAVLEFDDKREAYLQHMPQTRNDEAVDYLERYLGGADLGGVNKSRAVIMTPAVGKRGLYAVSKSWAESNWGRMAREGLVEAAVNILGSEADTQMIEYPWAEGQYNQMLVELLNTGESTIYVNNDPV